MSVVAGRHRDDQLQHARQPRLRVRRLLPGRLAATAAERAAGSAAAFAISAAAATFTTVTFTASVASGPAPTALLAPRLSASAARIRADTRVQQHVPQQEVPRLVPHIRRVHLL